MSKEKDIKFVLRIEPDLKEELENEAKQQNRSLNGHILHCLQNRVKPVEPSKPFNFKERVDKYIEFLKDDNNKGKEFKI